MENETDGMLLLTAFVTMGNANQILNANYWKRRGDRSSMRLRTFCSYSGRNPMVAHEKASD